MKLTCTRSCTIYRSSFASRTEKVALPPYNICYHPLLLLA